MKIFLQDLPKKQQRLFVDYTKDGMVEYCSLVRDKQVELLEIVNEIAANQAYGEMKQ